MSRSNIEQIVRFNKISCDSTHWHVTCNAQYVCINRAWKAYKQMYGILRKTVGPNESSKISLASEVMNANGV